MSNWKKVKVSDVCDVRDGTHESPKAKESGIYLLTSKNFSNGAVNFEKAQLISEYDFNIINKRSKVEIGDIVMPMIGTIGSPVLIVSEPNFAIKNVALFKTSNSQINASYLLRFLGSNLFFKYLESCSRGGTQKFVSLTDLRNIPIPIPPLEEQKRIAEILDKADELRRLRQESIKKLNTLSQSIFHEMFGDCTSKCELGALILKIESGKNIVGIEDESVNKYRVLKISAVNKDGFISSESKPLPNSYLPPNSHIVKDGDLLFSRANTAELVGLPCIVDYAPPNLALPDKLWRVIPDKNKLNKRYLEQTLKLKTVRAQIEQVCSGTSGSMKNISMEKFRSIEIPYPVLSLQNDFEIKYKVISNSIKQNLRQIELLDSLFQSLQHRAFNGEL